MQGQRILREALQDFRDIELLPKAIRTADGDTDKDTLFSLLGPIYFDCVCELGSGKTTADGTVQEVIINKLVSELAREIVTVEQPFVDFAYANFREVKIKELSLDTLAEILPGGNPNNTLAAYECSNCEKEFHYSVKHGCNYVSAVVDGNEIIMKGLPYGVSVRCKYTCNCSGSLTVKREHKSKGEMHSSSDGPGPGRGYRLVCARCGLDVLLSPKATYSPEINKVSDKEQDE